MHNIYEHLRAVEHRVHGIWAGIGRGFAQRVSFDRAVGGMALSANSWSLPWPGADREVARLCPWAMCEYAVER